MPTSRNQKMKILYLMKILLEQTDEEHALTIQELISALSEYSIITERKSVYSDIKLLRRYGLDIEMRKAKTVGYYVASRDFEVAELKLLIDAVHSSRSITQKKSDQLIYKLASLASTNQSQQLRRQVFPACRPKSSNESVYYSIDAIFTAIANEKAISFNYFDYDHKKSRQSCGSI